MAEIFHGILENSLGLVEPVDIDEIFIIEIHLVDAWHDAFELFLFGWVCFLDDVWLIDDSLAGGLVGSFLTFAPHFEY